MNSEKERMITAFLMQFSGLERVDAGIFQKRIESFNENHSIKLSIDELKEAGYIIFRADDERCTGVNSFMNDGYYILTLKAKQVIRQ